MIFVRLARREIWGGKTRETEALEAWDQVICGLEKARAKCARQRQIEAFQLLPQALPRQQVTRPTPLFPHLKNEGNHAFLSEVLQGLKDACEAWILKVAYLEGPVVYFGALELMMR